MNELKELLKPPFRKCDDGEFFNDKVVLTLHIATELCDKNTHKQMRNWVLEKINEGSRRDFAEPKKWIYHYEEDDEGEYETDYIKCPVCNRLFNSPSEYYNFCPNCGIKLQAE